MKLLSPGIGREGSHTYIVSLSERGGCYNVGSTAPAAPLHAKSLTPLSYSYIVSSTLMFMKGGWTAGTKKPADPRVDHSLILGASICQLPAVHLSTASFLSGSSPAVRRSSLDLNLAACAIYAKRAQCINASRTLASL